MKLISHPQIKIIWTILQNHFNIPNEIMIKILYTFKGIQNPVTSILFVDIHSSLDRVRSLKWEGDRGDELISLALSDRISYRFKYSLDRSRKIVIKNMNCSQCNFNSREWNFKSIHYLDTSYMFRSWTKSLLNLQETYGNKFENYLCDKCKNTTDMFT